MTRSIRLTPRFRTIRRFLFGSLTALTTLVAMGLLTIVFQKDGLSPLECLLMILYAALFTWICASFWTAVVGFLICLTRHDPFAISSTINLEVVEASTGTPPKTAIIMPIYNEEARRVFAGLRAIYQSLLETGQHEQFEIFILSDTRDPDIWIEEEVFWEKLCRELNAKGRIFYRNRQDNTGRKSGNIADFCKRWGGRYRYMIVLDADSMMSGSTLVKMVRLMDQNPRVALIQVPPVPVNRESLFARILQFSGSVYGRIFTAGQNFWHLGESNYWGHNAIIRVKPFVNYCGLPELPGKAPLGGEILSHDFVEAALLRGAGWEVWLAYDLGGSYEEIPPTLSDYAKRDRRWCQGNLQHSRLIFARGLKPLGRAHLLMGLMSYLASPLWFLFLVLTGIEAYIQTQREAVYFFGDNLFPVWPVSYAVEMTTVLVITLTMLFLPKLLGLLLLFRQPKTVKAYGGAIKASLSVVLESLFSMLLAPVLMMLQTKFVLAILLRRNVAWAEQKRNDHRTELREAVSAHAGQTLLGIITGTLAYWYVPAFFWWFIPVLLGLILSIPLSIFSSSIAAGRKSRELGLFLTPEETNSPPVLKLLRNTLHSGEETSFPSSAADGFLQAIVEPFVNALHTSLLPESPKSNRRKYYLRGLVYQLLEDGPESLSATEKRELLSDRDTVLQLHNLVWSLPLMEFDFGKKVNLNPDRIA